MHGLIKETVQQLTVNIGGTIIANPHGEDFNLTADKEYILLGYDGDCVQVENDLGKKDWYSTDYFYIPDKEMVVE